MSTAIYVAAARDNRTMILLQQAAIYASLWAIGSSWSTTIREIALTLVNEQKADVIAAELGASIITTTIGITVTILVSRPRICSKLFERTRSWTTTPQESSIFPRIDETRKPSVRSTMESRRVEPNL